MKKKLSLKENILIVDDKPEALYVLSELLIQQGYHVRAALNVDIALKSAVKFIPDLILMDVSMPGTDGFEACRTIKKMKKLEHVPVIFLTGKTDIRAKMTGFDAGGVDYITKPFANQEVIARIKTHLEIKQERERFYALSEATTEGILIHDNNIIVDINSAFEKIMYCSRKKIILQELKTIFSKETLQSLSTFSKHSSSFCEIQEKRPGGVLVFAEVRLKNMLYQGRQLQMIALRDITNTKRLKRENKTLMASISSTHRLGNMAGKSKLMQKVYEKIFQLAAIDETVMIYGETGTGKELAAKNIQSMSQRSQKPFVVVNCAAISNTLFESTFWGENKNETHEGENRLGLFEQADGGILFLDEIAELDINIQAKLLRIIETGEFTTSGGNHKHANVRIISATNRDLNQMVEQGNMREDFFHRLSVLSLTMPPLRERKEDIPLLVDYFIHNNQSLNMNNRTISNNIMLQLQKYSWPGNVRELFNELIRYFSSGELEHAATISPQMHASISNLIPDLNKPLTLVDAVSRFEHFYIQQFLMMNNGKKSNTAKLLGIDPKTLYNKLNKPSMKK